mgnify:CR=1 FL=1
MMKWFKGFSLATLILLLSVLIVGCGSDTTSEDGDDTENSGSSSEVTEVSFWAPFSGADGPFMKEIVDSYNNSQENVKVNLQIVPQTDYYTDVDLTLHSGEDVPELMIMHGDQILTYSEKGILKNLDAVLGDELKVDQYHEKGIDGATVDGNVYGLPLDIHPLMFYWNKDLFEAAGLDPEQPPKTREEFVEYAQMLTNEEENVYGYAVPTLWPQQFIFPTIVAQNGGSLYEDGEVNFTSPEVVEALQFQVDLINEYNVSPSDIQQDGEVTLFLQGRSAMHFNGPWMLEQFVNSELNFGVAPVPRLGTEQEAVFANSHNFVIPEKADEAKLDGVVDFLLYVQENALAWANSGQAPAMKATYESDEFQSVNIQSPQVAKQFEIAVFNPKVENWSQAVNPLMEAVNSALLGQKDVEQALEDAQKEATQALE